MRVLLKIQMENQAVNKAFQDGSMPDLMKSLVERLQPEAAYFLSENGVRTAMLFIDLKDPSQIPVIAEPLFRVLNAKLDLTPAMNFDDLQTGMREVMSARG